MWLINYYFTSFRTIYHMYQILYLSVSHYHNLLLDLKSHKVKYLRKFVVIKFFVRKKMALKHRYIYIIIYVYPDNILHLQSWLILLV